MTAAVDARPANAPHELMDAAIAGDREAYGLLYARYREVVFRYTYFRVGNRALAEDLTSDVFLRALTRIGTFTWQGRDPGAWFVTIARNLIADHFKSGYYRLSCTVEDTSELGRPDPLDFPPPGPEAVTVHYLVSRSLYTAVKQLSDEQRQCIILRFLHGLNVAETARAMSTTEGAVKALQYRAVRALGRLVPELGEGAAPRRLPRQTTPCEVCGRPVAGLLATCRRPACLAADIGETVRAEQRIEATS